MFWNSTIFLTGANTNELAVGDVTHIARMDRRPVAELLAERLKAGCLVIGGAAAGSKTPSE
ncbi:MAG: hypothetical protein R3C28_28895 [Pirellulaceae bacterium]